MITEEEKERVYRAWRIAADALSITVEAPYVLNAPNCGKVLFAAYLPDFGTSQGMVIGLLGRPTYMRDKALLSAAKSRGLYSSFISAEIYARYDEEVFKEALTDWGFFGSEERRPNWLPRPTKDE